MTIILEFWIFELILIGSILCAVFGGSFLVTNWLKKKQFDRHKKVENLAAFLLTILAAIVYFALQEQFVSSAYKGDVIMTESTANIISYQSARYVSTEQPLHLLNLFAYGSTYELPGLENTSVTVTTTDYVSFYKDVRYKNTYIHENQMFDFQTYVQEEIGPFVNELYTNERSEQEVLRMLEDTYPYHQFVFQ
ncbi:hypothetical protein [Bacillus solitudinis]|uniref:hypothetical protein n=1 Tax=Bacillus solitudinis TaxID=2014074 RepID=UPI000C248EE1|nr:hypothetical protein [Bacillus solitudinis]